MATSPIPEGYHTVTPYLTVRGVKGVLAFVKDALGAREIYRMEDERRREAAAGTLVVRRARWQCRRAAFLE
jgi:uncharacterized glyoxalase superfamily protein PhnB